MEDTEQKIGEVINRPYVRLAFIIVCLLLLSFVAFKEGFSLWLLSKLRLTSERFSPDSQAAINAFYPGMASTVAGAKQQLNKVVNAYNA
jgi:hypothetical protein